MLSFLLPIIATLLQLSAPAAEAPRLEIAARADDARELAADVIVDADAIVDVIALDGGVVIDLDLAGERHELRLELDRHGMVRGAALWWIGAATELDAWDTDAAIPALMETGGLDAVFVEHGAVTLYVGGERFVVEPLAEAEALL
jgi:hypothetical protein